MTIQGLHLDGSRGFQEADGRLLCDVLGRQTGKFLANLPINLVDSRGIGREKQLLPDVFAAPVCDAGSKITPPPFALDWRVEDSAARCDSRVFGVAGSFWPSAFASIVW